MSSKGLLIAVLAFVLGVGTTFPGSTAVAQTAPVSPEELQGILQKLQALYAPVAQKAGGEFQIQILWDRPSAGASANRDIANKYVIGVDGGMLVYKRLTSENLRMTLCHEAGHLFGGIPLRPAPAEWEGPLDESGKSLLSAEGQSDYYATSVCFRHLTAGQNHREFLKGRLLPRKLVQDCDAVWGVRSEGSFQCQRTALAGLDFLNFVMEFPISLSEQDDSVADKTLDAEYPSRQCRLDTLVAGALCKVQAPLDFIRKDRSAEGCAAGRGSRPACWHRNHAL
ncbi:hypothetical protein EZJ49_08220 [Bdellovibrio bacteriovorus]|uniref:hypothetical protein n=1 Tax=Bdellovibrio bacteriovorus TaxID=959 RepID=UPI0021D12BE7|nr:hypothetical protein [Bdellovibrio bacteriovorus]UXR66233.1 hypothetical protein EZJ49_08220 [Bdellovibrio bacteriovorus]